MDRQKSDRDKPLSTLFRSLQHTFLFSSDRRTLRRRLSFVAGCSAIGSCAHLSTAYFRRALNRPTNNLPAPASQASVLCFLSWLTSSQSSLSFDFPNR